MEPLNRIELSTSSLPRKCSTPELQRPSANDERLSSRLKHRIDIRNFSLSGRRGSNPRPTAWKAVALPTELLPQYLNPRVQVVGRGGFEPPKLSQQIYSLPHLATLVSPRHKTTRASCRNRTSDLLITNQLLYQLS